MKNRPAATTPQAQAHAAPHPLAIYDAACKAVAEAKSIYKAKEIRDQAVAMAVYARQAKNRDLEGDAIVIRMRATRRLDELRRAQAETVGLNQGAVAGKTGLFGNPVLDLRPTLGSQGIDKNLAHQARVLGALTDEQFEAKIGDARAAVNRAVRNVVAEAELDQERERAKTCVKIGGVAGCTIEDLIALVESGYRAGAILIDSPWGFQCWDGNDKRVASRGSVTPYDTMEMADIAALPIGKLAAPDCVLFLWVVWPTLPEALGIIESWDFEYRTCAFSWTKADADGADVYMGLGYWTRANTEACLLAVRGTPKRLNADVRQAIVEPRREHSRKPDCIFERIERLVRGPYLELFARPTSPGLTRPGWTCWGDEIPRADFPAPAAAEPPPREAAAP
jgi:N6-adenosine-specific RNA methylase IME4